MRKVGIISIHYGVNFGSSLQAYALSHYINERYKMYTEIVNYIPPRYRYNRLYKKPQGNISSYFRWGVRSLRHIIIDNKYKHFLKRVANVSPVILSETSAQERYKDYDYLIAGSDQIWNSDYNEGIDGMYYLSFGGYNTKKIAYAASTGKTSFAENEWETQRNYLKEFNSLSYREKFMIELMENHGIKNGKFVLDPTFLLNEKQWSRIEKKPKKLPEKYLLIYFLDVDDCDMVKSAVNIARRKNLKTAIITNGRKSKYKNVDCVASNLTPNYYLYLFRNADYIITNSFHGTAFSINFQKQFAVFRRDKYNGRLDNILGAFGIEDRYISLDNNENAFNAIDYSDINKLKDNLICDSKKYLDEALK